MDNRLKIRNNESAGNALLGIAISPLLQPARPHRRPPKTYPEIEAPCMPVGRPFFAACPKCSRLALASAFGLALVLSGSLASAAPPKHVNYSRDIRPILSNTCYKCHGPDEKQRKAGLRLDTKEGACAKLESGEVAIVPGSSTKSAMYQRLTSHDADVKMPPPDSGKTVSAEQIELIKQWIDEGAEFHP